MKAIIPRAQAQRDIHDIVDYYRQEAGAAIAIGFVDELQAVLNLIAAHPASGSLRYSYELALPDLRCHRLSRYPYLVFYIDQADHIDMWRVLHAKRDIPAWMDETVGDKEINK